MKPAGLLKLIILSFALVAFWLASAPGSEHPWDEDEIVASDSTGANHDNPAEPGDGEDLNVRMFLNVPQFFRPVGFNVMFIGIGQEKNATHRKSLVPGTKKPLSDLPVLRLIEHKK